MNRQTLCVLGSTGSIGRNTLQIVQQFPELFKVSVLAAHRNVDLLAEQSYTDVGWAGDARQYTIVAVDTNEVESLGRSIALPLVEAAFLADALVRRGVMNRLTYTVENGSTERVENIRLKVDLAGHLHTSDKFGIDAGQATVVPVVAGGFSDLPD